MNSNPDYKTRWLLILSSKQTKNCLNSYRHSSKRNIHAKIVKNLTAYTKKSWQNSKKACVNGKPTGTKHASKTKCSTTNCKSKRNTYRLKKKVTSWRLSFRKLEMNRTRLIRGWVTSSRLESKKDRKSSTFWSKESIPISSSFKKRKTSAASRCNKRQLWLRSRLSLKTLSGKNSKLEKDSLESKMNA